MTALAAPMAIRRPKRSVVVRAGDARDDDLFARQLLALLAELGVETTYAGRNESAGSIASVAVEAHADTIELCLGRGMGVKLLRDLLRELVELGRRDVSIVVHRMD